MKSAKAAASSQDAQPADMPGSKNASTLNQVMAQQSYGRTVRRPDGSLVTETETIKITPRGRQVTRQTTITPAQPARNGMAQPPIQKVDEQVTVSASTLTQPRRVMRTKIRFGTGFEQRHSSAASPAAVAQAQDKQSGDKHQVPSHSVSMDVEHAHLLVVDDDPELRELTQAYLQQQGFDVATVDCGESMDAYLNQHQVDLLILDLMLPGEHGLSIAQRLKKRQDLPIIIVSAQGDDVDRIVGLEVGADDYLSKPFNPRELLARVRAVLRRSGRGDPVWMLRHRRFNLANSA